MQLILKIFAGLTICASIQSCGLSETVTMKHIKTLHFSMDWTKYCEIEYCHPDKLKISKGNETLVICECENIYDINIIDEKEIILTLINNHPAQKEPCLIKKSAFDIPVKIKYLDHDSLYLSPKLN